MDRGAGQATGHEIAESDRTATFTFPKVDVESEVFCVVIYLTSFIPSQMNSRNWEFSAFTRTLLWLDGPMWYSSAACHLSCLISA